MSAMEGEHRCLHHGALWGEERHESERRGHSADAAGTAADTQPVGAGAGSDMQTVRRALGLARRRNSGGDP